MYFALSRYVYDGNASPPGWYPSIDAGTGVDLRPLSQQGLAAHGTQGGHGIFRCDADPTGQPDTVVLTDDPQSAIEQSRLLAAGTALGLTLSANRLDDLLFELFTDHADASGVSFARPIIPQANRDLRVALGPAVDKSRRFDIDDPQFRDKILAVHRADLARLKREMPGSDKPRMVLGGLVKKYRARDHTIFFANPRDAFDPLPPQTTITESFNQGDSSTLGPDLTWAETEGDLSTVSNLVNCVTSTGAGIARAESDLSSDDHYGQLVTQSISGAIAAVGVTARHSASVQTFYLGDHQDAGATDQQRLYKRVTGSFTLLDITDPATISTPDTLKLICNGTTISLEVNGGAGEGPVTDSAISGNVRCGVRLSRNSGAITARGDSFEAADLAAAAVPYGYRPLLSLGVGA